MKLRNKINQIHQVNFNNLHIYFFYIFLFLIPFQARKVFLTDYSFYSGSFTEYTTYFLYASDAFLFLAILFWLVFNEKLIKHQKTIELNNIISGVSGMVKSSKVLLFLLIFVDWLIIDSAINNKYLEISAFQIIKFVELSFLFVYIYHNLKNKKELITSLFIVSIAGFLQSVIAIYQFSFQHSLFESPLLHKITGETIIGSNLPGVAKIVFGGEKIARAYGAFPHPNILGGFLIFSIILSIYLYLEHKNYILSSLVRIHLFLNQLRKLKWLLFLLRLKESVYNNFNKYGLHKKADNYIGLNYNTYSCNCQHNRNKVSVLWAIFVFIQFVGLIFSFSRSAWAGFFISVFILLIFHFHNFLKNVIVSRETILKFRLFRFLRSAFDAFFFIRYYNKNENLSFFILFTALLTFFLIIYSPLINTRLDGESFYSNDNIYLNYNYDGRNFYNNVSRETIRENLLTGSGIGTSIFQINKYLEENNIDYNLRYWQYQPAHNVYLLVVSEIGLVGFLLFVLFVAKVLVYGMKKCEKHYICNCSIDMAIHSSLKQACHSDRNEQETNKWSGRICKRDYVLFNLSHFSKNILSVYRFLNSLSLARNDRNNKNLSGANSPDSKGDSKKHQFYNLYSSSSNRKKDKNHSSKPKINSEITGFPNPPDVSKENNISPACQTDRRETLFGDINCRNYDFKELDDKYVSRETYCDYKIKLRHFFLAVFIGFLFIGLFDHYFWTLQQGQLTFWLVLGIMLSVSDYKK